MNHQPIKDPALSTSDPEVLRKVAERIRKEGPTRVQIDDHYAVTPRRAEREHHATPVIVFIRGDCWSLGAIPGHVMATHKQWKREWTHVMETNNDGSWRDPITIQEWRGDNL